MTLIIYISSILAVVVYVLTRFRYGGHHVMLALVMLAAFGLSAFPFFYIDVQGVRTGLQAAIPLAAMVYGMVVRKEGARFLGQNCAKNRALQMLAILSFLVAFYVMAAGATNLSQYKTAVFVVTTVIPVAALAALGPYGRDEGRTIIGSLIGCAVMQAGYVLYFGDIEAVRAGAAMYVMYGEGQLFSPIMAARIIGFGVLLITFSFVFSRQKMSKAWLVISPGIALVLFAIMVSTGSRGPVLAILISLVVGFGYIFAFRLVAKRLIIMGLIIGILSVAALPQNWEYWRRLPGVERIFPEQQEYAQIIRENVRIFLFQSAIEDFVDSGFIGRGTGNSTITVNSQGRSYPHNFILEVAAEQGILGLLALFGFIGAVVYYISKLRRREEQPSEARVLAVLVVYSVMNASVSGDLTANNGVWIFGMISSYFAISRFEFGSPEPRLSTKEKEKKDIPLEVARYEPSGKV